MKLVGIIFIIIGLIGMSGSIGGGLILSFVGAALIAGSKKSQTPKASPKNGAWSEDAIEKVNQLQSKVHSSWLGKDEKDYSHQMVQVYEKFFTAAEALNEKEREIAYLTENLEPLFTFLATTENFSTAEQFVARAEALNFNNEPAESWVYCRESIRQDKLEVKWQEMITSNGVNSCVAEMLAYAHEKQDLSLFLRIADLCCDAKLWVSADLALTNVLQLTDKGTKDKVWTKKASVFLLSGCPDRAAEALINAYPLAKLSGVKSRISKIEVEFRKALKAMQVASAKEACDKILQTAVAEGIDKAKELLHQTTA